MLCTAKSPFFSFSLFADTIVAVGLASSVSYCNGLHCTTAKQRYMRFLTSKGAEVQSQTTVSMAGGKGGSACCGMPFEAGTGRKSIRCVVCMMCLVTPWERSAGQAERSAGLDALKWAVA